MTECTLSIDKLRENILKDSDWRLIFLPFVITENKNDSDVGRRKRFLKGVDDDGPAIESSVNFPIDAIVVL